MRGGTIIVDGNAGNEIGLSMQKGIIAIGGQAGDMIGFNMAGGTILVLGNAGIRPGAGMRGGPIALLGQMPSPILPSFRLDRTAAPEKATAVLHELREKGMKRGTRRFLRKSTSTSAISSPRGRRNLRPKSVAEFARIQTRSRRLPAHRIQIARP